MTTYTHKRIGIIFTGGTVAGNVAKSAVSQNVKSDPNSFKVILENSVDIVKKNWEGEVIGRDEPQHHDTAEASVARD